MPDSGASESDNRNDENELIDEDEDDFGEGYGDLDDIPEGFHIHDLPEYQSFEDEKVQWELARLKALSSMSIDSSNVI